MNHTTEIAYERIYEQSLAETYRISDEEGFQRVLDTDSTGPKRIIERVWENNS